MTKRDLYTSKELGVFGGGLQIKLQSVDNMTHYTHDAEKTTPMCFPPPLSLKSLLFSNKASLLIA